MKASRFRSLTLISMLVVFVGLFANLFLGILLARHLGPEGYGQYVFAFSLIGLCIIPFQFGLPVLVVREVAISDNSDFHQALASILRFSTEVLSFGLIIESFFIIGLLAFMDFEDPQRSLFLYSAALLPVLALIAICSAFLRGLGMVIEGQLPSVALRPVLFLAVLAGVVYYSSLKLTASTAMQLHLIAALFVCLYVFIKVRKALPSARRFSVSNYDRPKLFKALMFLGLISGSAVLVKEMDVVLLGVITNTSNVGVYKVSLQAAMLAGIGLRIVNMFLPYYAVRAGLSDSTQSLQKLATLGSRVTFFVAVMTSVVFFTFGSQIIEVLFGAEYGGAYLPLLVLLAGQVANGYTGSANMILALSGHERAAAATALTSLTVNAALNLTLIPKYGILGAALATSGSMIGQNLILYFLANKRLGINTSPW